MVGIDLGTTNSAVAVRSQASSVTRKLRSRLSIVTELARRHRSCRRTGGRQSYQQQMARPCRLWSRSWMMAACWSARSPSGARAHNHCQRLADVRTLSPCAPNYQLHSYTAVIHAVQALHCAYGS